jgi:cleavage and polyadenylation specificity factor subunit 1
MSAPLFVAEGLSFLHPTLNPEPIFRRSPIRETLTELLVADLGDETAKSAYLFVSIRICQLVGPADFTSYGPQVMM